MSYVTYIRCDKCGKEVVATVGLPYGWTVELKIVDGIPIEFHYCEKCSKEVIKHG